MKYIAIWGLTAIASMLIAGAVAAWKNRDVSFWMGWSFVLPPMLIALLILSPLKQPRLAQNGSGSDDDDSPDR